MSGDFGPSATIEVLKKRSDLLQQVRAFFLERDFMEVDTPMLSADTVVDRYIEPISVSINANGNHKPMFLQTSPEFAMKRLLAGSAKRIFQLGKAFRNGECGRQHQPEFTMLEWYRTGDSYEQGRQLLDEFVQSILRVPPALQLTYREALIRFAEIDPYTEDSLQLQRSLSSLGIEISSADGEVDRDNLLNLALSQLVEPKLKHEPSVIIYDWPATQSALAKVRNDNRFAVAERFEIYVNGMELANGYHELTDANELATRNDKVNRQRLNDGGQELPVESRMLRAMQSGLPESCGTALGFDRLLMLKIGEDDIRNVVPFDFDRA